MAQKYYVVWKGRKTGIYQSWPECENQIKGFEGAMYKSFLSLKAAQIALSQKPEIHIYAKKNQEIKKLFLDINDSYIAESLSVDAACSGNPGIMEYRGVHTKTGEELFHGGPFKLGTNNIGEFMAIVHGLSFLKSENWDVPIYSDSQIAIGWIKAKKAKTKLDPDLSNDNLFELLEQSEMWLNENNYKTKIIKWNTAVWGEIPADFGRKNT